MGLRTWIIRLLERKRLQKWVELEEKHLHHKILRSQLQVIKLSLREMRREVRVERRIRERKPKGYIC